MNKTKIEWADATWNPVTGCAHGCAYCYAKRIAERFGGHSSGKSLVDIGHPITPLYILDAPMKKIQKDGKEAIAPFPYWFTPTLHRYRMDEPKKWKKPRTVFVCSMADLFGVWVKEWWITAVMRAAKEAPQHRYLFLTKHPARYVELAHNGKLPAAENMWYGTTATTEEKAIEASNVINDLPYGYKKFLSIEPICGPLRVSEWDWISSFDWVIIGAETGNRSGKFVPEKSWINYIVASCAARGVPVFMKDSLIPVVGEENMRREFPW
ncbi:MAG: DUF5131 family protein [Clostridia bacterium]|nr:DUF5131 family protein [Clostridia bacterium]